MYNSIKDKLIALDKEMGLSTTLIKRRFKVTLEMAMELRRKFDEENTRRLSMELRRKFDEENTRRLSME